MFVLKKRIRDIIITGSICLAIIAVGLSVIQLFVPKYQLMTTSLLEAQSEAKISYEVHVKDNPVYEKKVLAEGGHYLKPFTDYIDIRCQLSIAANESVDISTINRIDVVLVSQLGTDDEAVVIWERKENYAEPAVQESSDGTVEVDRTVKLYFEEYDSLVNELVEEHELITDYYIKVLFDTDITIEYEEEIKEESLNPELIIPFSNQIYHIEGNNELVQDIIFEQETNERISIDYSLIILFGAIFAIAVGTILLILFKTKAMTKEDEHTVRLAKIFKKYGDRLAGLSEPMAYQSSVMISIDKMEDMVKIADEIGQTIFYYKVEDDVERKIEFYIFDEGKIYYLVMFGEL